MPGRQAQNCSRGSASRIRMRCGSQGRRLIGRDDVLERMIEACRAARSGATAVIEITGAPGFGKSALLQAFGEAVPAVFPEALVIRGRCYEHESVPFKALDALIDDLSRQLRGGYSKPARWCPRMSALARLFPCWSVWMQSRRWRGGVRCRSQIRANFDAALLQLSHCYWSVSVRHLVVLCLDDVQWGDADSAALFQYMYLAAAVPRFVLTVTCQSEDADRGFLRLLREHVTGAGNLVIHQTEKIEALTPDAAGELARLLLERHGLQSEDPGALAAECGGKSAAA